MIDRYFKGRLIGLLDFEDVAVEQRAIEFTDPAIPVMGSHVAILVPDEGPWSEAKVQINGASEGFRNELDASYRSDDPRRLVSAERTGGRASA